MTIKLFLVTSLILTLTLSIHGGVVKDDVEKQSTDKPEVVIPVSTETPLNPYSCDHLQGYKGVKKEELEGCCGQFPKGTFDCTSEPEVGHVCTSYLPPVCCQCTHLPPPPPKRAHPVQKLKPKPSQTQSEDTEEEDDDDEGDDA